MARPIRIEFEGALYHVTSRGDRQLQNQIFLGSEAYVKQLLDNIDQQKDEMRPLNYRMKVADIA